MMTYNNFKKLRNEIVLNSLFLKDYSNSFYIKNKTVCAFFDSAIDDIQYDYISYIEAVMFNTGFEIMIHEGDNIPLTADDIDGYSDYIAFDSCDMLDDIAAYLNTSKDNIKFYEIEKTVQYTKIIYKEVN